MIVTMQIIIKGVSTTVQDFEAQIKRLEKEGCSKEYIYTDKFTGTKDDRPNFQRALKILKVGDTLVVTKLDRFARSTLNGIKIIKDLFERGIRVQVLNMGVVENTVKKYSYTQVEKITGISKSTLVREKKERLRNTK